MFLFLALTLGFLAAALLAAGLLFRSQERTLAQRLEQIQGGANQQAEQLDDYLDRQQRGPLGALLSPISAFIAPLLSAEFRRGLRKKLARAGLLKVLGETDYVLLYVLTLSIGAISALLFYRWSLDISPLQAMTGAGLLALIGLLAPEYVVNSGISRRQAKVRKTLADAIDLMVASVEAGTGFDAAMSQVQRRFHGPIAEEFGRALDEMRLGKRRSAALRSFAERVGVEEVNVFVAAVCQAEVLGTSLGKVLRVQSQVSREKRLYKAKEAAQKLPVKMLFPLVFFIFPVTFVVIIGPGVLRIIESLAN